MFTLEPFTVEQILQLPRDVALGLIVKWGEERGAILRNKAVPVGESLTDYAQNGTALSSIEKAFKSLLGHHSLRRTVPPAGFVREPWMSSRDTLLQDIAKLEALRAVTESYGLAMCQVGHTAKAFVAACWPLPHLPHAANRPHVPPAVFIDPEILDMSGQQTNLEKCMSIDDTVAVVTRARNVEMRFMNAAAETSRSGFSDYYTAILQHETDHLYGELVLGKADLLLSDQQFMEYQQTKTLPKTGRNLEDYNYSM